MEAEQLQALLQEAFGGPGGQQIVHKPATHGILGCIRKSAADAEVPSTQPWRGHT